MIRRRPRGSLLLRAGLPCPIHRRTVPTRLVSGMFCRTRFIRTFAILDSGVLPSFFVALSGLNYRLTWFRSARRAPARLLRWLKMIGKADFHETYAHSIRLQVAFLQKMVAAASPLTAEFQGGAAASPGVTPRRRKFFF